jgi:archaellum component FlaF (FlaF/FlaG flagellin family)
MLLTSFNFMNTEQLQITHVTFNIANDNLIVTVANTGTVDVTITSVTITGNGITSTDALAANVIFDVAGTTTSMVIDIQGDMFAGSIYNIELLSSKGNKFTCTDVA